MTELRQCSDCRKYSDDVEMVPEFVDEDTGDAHGTMLCRRCKWNRIALKNEDARVQLGDERRDWND